MIPASRRHNYANDPPPGSPLFFASTLQLRPRTSSTALMLSLPLRCTNRCPTRSSHFPRYLFSLLQALYLSSILCSSAIRPGPVRVPFSRVFRLEARCGTKRFGFRNVLVLPAKPSLLGSGRVKRILFAAWIYSRLRILWSPRPRWRLGARKKNGAEPVRNWLHESAPSLTEFALKIP